MSPLLLALVGACTPLTNVDLDGDGYSSSDGDCDDLDRGLHPGATDPTGDALDTDCDGVDGADRDGDGYAADWSGGPDCDDEQPTVNPEQTETCDDNLTDEDCDGLLDDEDPTVSNRSRWHPDEDGDGFGDSATAREACRSEDGELEDDSDCDDTREDVHAGAPERCDGVDNDCDGDVDGGATDLDLWYADADGDGFGDPLTAFQACDGPEGNVTEGGDCLDTDPAVNPDAAEICGNGVDDDCSGPGSGCGWPGTLEAEDADVILEFPTFAGQQLSLANLGPVDGGAHEALFHSNGEAIWIPGPLVGSDTSSVGLGSYSVGLPAGDLDADGQVDLLLAEAGVYLLRGPLEPWVDVEATAWGRLAVGPSGGTVAPTATDLDGDSTSELLVSGGSEVWLFAGPLEGALDPVAAATVVESAAESLVPWVVSDLDGDGLPEVVVSDAEYGNGGGAVYVFYAPPAGSVDTNDADAMLVGEETLYGSFVGGPSVRGDGDVTGDGHGDLVVGAPSAGAVVDGAVYIFSTPATGLDQMASADSVFYGSEHDALGESLPSSGDYDGDTKLDLTLAWNTRVEDDHGRLEESTHVAIFYQLAAAAYDATGADVVVHCGGCGYGAPVLGDLDADADAVDDLLIASADQELLYVFLGIGP